MAWWSCGVVGAGGAGEGEFGVGVAGDGPAAGVHESVVVATEEQAVVEVGVSAVDPVNFVVTITKHGWHAATGCAAVPVTNHEGFT